VKEGERRKKERVRGKERERRRGGSHGLHFFQGTVVQDFLSEFLVSTLPLGSHWA
jgi:hypothetical protein